MRSNPSKIKILFGAAASDFAEQGFAQPSSATTQPDIAQPEKFKPENSKPVTSKPQTTKVVGAQSETSPIRPGTMSAADSWGPAARGALSATYSPKKHLWIAKVIAQIDAELLDIGMDDQSRVALGIETRLPSGYMKRQLASPWIFSLEALNTFCEYNWPQYAKHSATQVWPRRWFWVTDPSNGVRPRRADTFAERKLGE